MMTFVIPTYNEETRLERCLSSIRNQTIKSEIMVVDGGSTDLTKQIVLDFGCKLIDNPLRIAEFGLKQGILQVKTPYLVVFAADNELPHKSWVSEVLAIFKIYPYLSALWGRIGASKDDPPITKYLALIQNDPLCWFLNPPHVWGANGLVYKTKDIQPIFDVEGYVGDNDAFQTLVEQGKEFYYINELFVYHHYAKSLKDCFRKWYRNHSQHYLGRKRNMRWAGTNWKLKAILWVFYAIFLSLPHSIYLAIKDKNKYWLYHFPMNLTQLGAYIYAKCRYTCL